MKLKRGFSIAEALIACTLLSGISICLFGVWAMHARATDHNRDGLVASAWAEQVMEGALSEGYTCTNTSVETFHVTHIVADQKIKKEYFYQTYVEEPHIGVPGLKHVVVKVTWEHEGQWKSVQVVTQLSWQG